MKVSAKAMWMAVKNASLFCRQKTWNGGEVQIELGVDGKASVTSSDDFMSVFTNVDIEKNPQDPNKVYIPYKGFKDLERSLRDQVESHREAVISLDLSSYETEPSEQDWWIQFEQVVSSIGRNTVKLSTWEINPERLALLNRLEPKGEYPLSWLGAKHQGDLFLAFRYGPDTVGILVPLDRENLPAEQKEWLW